jgi:hypothetical protein
MKKLILLALILIASFAFSTVTVTINESGSKFLYGCVNYKVGTDGPLACWESIANNSAYPDYGMGKSGYSYVDGDIDSCSGIALPCLTWNGNMSGCASQIGCRYSLGICTNFPNHLSCSEANYSTQAICNSQYNCKWTVYNESVAEELTRQIYVFDVSGIPTGSYIISANQTIRIDIYGPVGNVYNQTPILCVLSNSSVFASATWNNRSSTQKWGSYGGNDCAPASAPLFGSLQIEPFVTNVNKTANLQPSDISCWVNNAGCNNGTMLKMNETIHRLDWATNYTGRTEARNVIHNDDLSNVQPSFIMVRYTTAPYITATGENYSGAVPNLPANLTNHTTMFNATVNDDESPFNGTANYIFSWNGSGANCDTWNNDSSVSLNGVNSGDNVSVIKQVGKMCEGKTIGYKFYVTDNWGAGGSSAIQTLYKTSCGIVNSNLVMNYNYSTHEILLSTCLTVNVSGLTINCNGNHINMQRDYFAPSYDTRGITDTKNNTTIKNCNIRNSSLGISSVGTFYSNYSNNTFLTVSDPVGTYYASGGIYYSSATNLNLSGFYGGGDNNGAFVTLVSSNGTLNNIGSATASALFNASDTWVSIGSSAGMITISNSALTHITNGTALHISYSDANIGLSNVSISSLTSGGIGMEVDGYAASENVTAINSTFAGGFASIYAYRNADIYIYNSTITTPTIGTGIQVNASGGSYLYALNSTINFSKIFVYSLSYYPYGGGTVDIARYAKIFVTNGTPISNANINVSDNMSATVFSGITNSTGYSDMFILNQTRISTSSNASYTAHNFAANATHNTAGYNQSAINNSKTIQINLNYFKDSSTTRAFLNGTEANKTYYVNSTTSNLIYVRANTTSDCTIDLFENSTLVNSSAVTVTYYRAIAGGMNNTIFNYTAICNETTLYNASSANWNATVIDNSTYRVPPNLHLHLNNTEANVTYPVNNSFNNSIWVYANSSSAEGTIDIYENGTLVASGSSTGVNYTRNITFENNGSIFNYTAIYAETLNYNSSSANWNATVLDNSTITLAAPCPSVIPLITAYFGNKESCVLGYCFTRKIPTKKIYFPLLIGNLTDVEKKANVYLLDYKKKIKQTFSWLEIVFPSQDIGIKVDSSCTFKNKLMSYLDNNKKAFW